MTLTLLSKERSSVFEYLGLVVFGYVTLKLVYRILNNIGTFFLGFGSVNLKKYGPWAIVTGCTDGIGKAYAEQLAKRGINIVLISRSLDKLQEQAKQIKEKYSVETKVIAADFTDPVSIYPKIKSEVADMDIGILINNVGMSYRHPEYFDAVDDKTVTDLLNCNIMSVTKMTAIVLPNMLKNKRGIIVNNASASGRLPTPLLTVYSSTKAYVDFFSRALNLEYASRGIIVQSLSPYFVSTKLSAMRSSLMAPKPNEYVASALKTIGSQSETNGCLVHNIQGWVFENLIGASLFGKIALGNMIAVRNKAIAKAKKQQQPQKND